MAGSRQKAINCLFLDYQTLGGAFEEHCEDLFALMAGHSWV